MALAAIVSVGTIFLGGCSRCGTRGKRIDRSLEAMKERGYDALRRSDNQQAFLIGDSILDILSESGRENVEARINGLVIKGQGAILSMQHGVDPLPLLSEAEDLCRKTGNDFTLASVYNGLGLYYLKVRKNSKLALLCFYKGVEAARRSGNDHLYGLLLANIALTHIGNNSSIGLRYAFECYNYGKEHDNDKIVCVGALASADLYRQRGETELALKMIKEAEKIILANNYDEKCNLYRIYGEILYRGKNYSEAEKYMLRALDVAEAEDDIFIKTSISYASMLMATERRKEALAVLKRAEERMNATGDNFFRIPLLLSLSEAYAALGDKTSADRYRKTHDEEQHLVTEAENKEKIRDLQEHYDQEMAENAIVRNELKLLKERQTVMILIVVIIVILLAAIPLIVLYRRKSQLYTAIVKQTAETVNNEKVLRETLRGMENKLKQAEAKSDAAASDTPKTGKDEGTTKSILSDEKYLDILGRLQVLMLDSEVYTANDISQEKVAKMIGTNRTYLSRIINEYYGITFTRFIANLRIKEAVRRLADTADDTPIKKLSSDLGFNSLSTFYSQFSAETGITPASYRERAVRLKLGKKTELQETD